MTTVISVTGLAELRRALKDAEHVEARNEFRRGLKRAADVVAQEAKTRVPVRSGAAQGSIRAVSGGNKAYVAGGKAAVPYYGWLDFGRRTPRTGNPRSVGPWAKSGKGPARGRFIYAALDSKDREVVDLVEDAVVAALRSLGL